jgi:hypothetical protein
MTAVPLFFPDDDSRRPSSPRIRRPSSSPMTTVAPLFFPNDDGRAPLLPGATQIFDDNGCS